MNIYAKKGEKITVTEETIKNGSDTDRRRVEKYIAVGKTYTVDSIVVMAWSSRVFIKEVPKLPFNTVLFKDQEPEISKEKAK